MNCPTGELSLREGHWVTGSPEGFLLETWPRGPIDYAL